MNLPSNSQRGVNEWVDAVYVLSVKTFAERIAHIQGEMQRHGIAFQFVFEYDASELSNETIDAVFAPSDLKKSQQSLVMKNLEVWRRAVEAGHQRVLVFEDDAVLAPDFVQRFDEAMRAARNLAPGWLVFLGGLDTKVPEHYFLNPGPLVELPIATAEGYVSDQVAMARRLEWAAEHRISLPADFLIRRMDQDKDVKQYWLRHPIVEQGSVLGLFSSVLDRSRQKHSLFYNKLRNRWSKFQRRRLREFLVKGKALLGMTKDMK